MRSVMAALAERAPELAAAAGTALGLAQEALAALVATAFAAIINGA